MSDARRRALGRRPLVRIGLALMALAATIALAACGGGIEELPENSAPAAATR